MQLVLRVTLVQAQVSLLDHTEPSIDIFQDFVDIECVSITARRHMTCRTGGARISGLLAGIKC
jgi:hypothetical protein